MKTITVGLSFSFCVYFLFAAFPVLLCIPAEQFPLPLAGVKVKTVTYLLINADAKQYQATFVGVIFSFSFQLETQKKIT